MSQPYMNCSWWSLGVGGGHCGLVVVIGGWWWSLGVGGG